MDTACALILADGFFERKRSLRQILGAWGCAVAVIFLYFYSPMWEYLPQAFSFGVMTISVWWCFRTGFLYSLLIVVMSEILVGTVEIIGLYGISAFWGIAYSELVWKKLLYTVIATSCKTIEVFITYLIRKLQHGRKRTPIRTSWLILTMIFPIFSVSLLLFIFATFQTRDDLSIYGIVFTVLLVAANIAIVYLLNLMEKRTREEEQVHLMHQQMEIQTNSILALEKSYRDQRAATHEFRNQLRTLGDLLANGQPDEAFAYIRQLQQTDSVRSLPVNTHHPIMDAILNQKYQQAQESGIDIQFQVSDLSHLKLKTDSMVVLFSNLLDNAIEACQRIDGERIIRCSIIAEEGLYLSVKNTSPPVLIEDGTIRTKKQAPREHGFGLLSIQRILREHGAEYSFDYLDGWFRFAAELPEV